MLRNAGPNITSGPEIGSGQPQKVVFGWLLKQLLKQGAKHSGKAAPKFGQKTIDEVTKRGWTLDSVKKVMERPLKTVEAKNSTNGNRATAYFKSENQYVVVDDVTGDIVQVSNLNDPGWIVNIHRW